MKITRAISAAAAILAASCATTVPHEKTSAQTRLVAERFVASFSSAYLGEMEQILASDVRWNLEGLLGREGSDRASLIGALREFGSEFPYARVETPRLFVDGPRAIACGWIQGRLAGERSPHWVKTSIEGWVHIELGLQHDRISSVRWVSCDDVILEEELDEEALEYESHPEWFLAALDLAGPTRALTLNPYPDTSERARPDRDPASGVRRSFEGFVITGSAAIENTELRERLSGLLYQGLYLGGLSAQCFQPRHALEVDWRGEKLWVVICFECGKGYVERENGNQQSFEIDSRPEPAFSKIYRSLGLTVAPNF